ncbi:MAG: aryl-sulfate sulfotransferase [Flavobacteriaceae bacterium]
MASCQSEPTDSPIDPDTIEPVPEEPLELASEVEVYNEDLIDSTSLIFGVDNGQKRCFLINKQGELLKEWNFHLSLGNDIFLESDGSLTGMFKPEATPPFNFGGYGGVIQIINPDENVQWSYEVHDENKLAHHDVERLPNGNVMFLVWERTSIEQASELGETTNYDLFTESIWEVNPQNNEVVWKWNSIDHIVQTDNPNHPNYGDPESTPEKINLGRNDIDSGDIMHANALFYDEKNDLIYISVNFYDEVWVIDHSTTTEQAKGSSGGNYNLGGDLIYRFGNGVFDRNHHPNIVAEGFPGSGNILTYSNGNSIQQSIIYELELPANYPTAESPKIKWSFTNSEIYSGIVSGATRLKNGNTLITEGDYGFWEVTPNWEVVWKYKANEKLLWRGYIYYPEDEVIQSLNLR